MAEKGKERKESTDETNIKILGVGWEYLVVW